MKAMYLVLVTLVIAACGGSDAGKSNPYNTADTQAAGGAGGTETYDPNRGEGKWTAENVNVGQTLDAAMAASGESIQAVKCASCHKLTEERLVGPGWKGVTLRKRPEWIMNFITNPDPMINKDPEVQAQLEICLVRMPNQNLADQEARDILEFMRKNDGVQ
jgi:mono/diheme cytochrome c family protein